MRDDWIALDQRGATMPTTAAMGVRKTPAVLLSMFLAASMLLTVTNATPASARSEGATAARLAAVGEDTAAAAAKLERFVVRHADGTLAFRANTRAATAGVRTATLLSLKASMEYTNKLVRQGVLATTTDLDVYATDATYSLQSVGSAWYWRWWGVEAHFDSFWTNKLINALNVGAGIAGVTAVVCSATGVCGVAAGIIAGILAIGSGVIGFCSNANGVVVKRTHAGPSWCQGH